MDSSKNHIKEVQKFLSLERLNTFRLLTNTDEDAILLHQQTMHLGAVLMEVLGTAEIAIRNCICQQLDNIFGTPDWLFNPPPPFSWKPLEKTSINKARKSAQRAVYQKLNQAQKHALDAIAFPNGYASLSHEQIVNKRLTQIPVANGQVVAQLTLFFWKRLFSEEYEKILWKRGLKRVFPNKKLPRAQIADHMEILYQARNRIAHHEPIYGSRLKGIRESIDFLRINFATKYPAEDTAFAMLLAPHKNHLDEEIVKFSVVWDRLTTPTNKTP